jgi:hypothetical protein
MNIDEINFSIFSEEDLRKLAAGQIEDLSIPALKYLAGEEYTPGEVVARASERGTTANLRGTSDLVGLGKTAAVQEEQVATPGYEDPLSWMGGTPLSPEAERSSLADPQEKQKTDFEREYEFRVMQEQSPWWANSAYIATSVVADPTNLLAVGLGKKVWQGAVAFGALGGATAAVEPVYEEWGDDRLTNIGYGLGFGAVLGAGATKLSNVLEARAAKKSAAVEADGTAKPLTEEEEALAAEGNRMADELIGSEDPTQATITQATKALDNVATTASLPILPTRLAGAKPKYGSVDLNFETDIDKAFYIIGNPKSKSAKHDEYVDYLSKALGVPEAEVMKVASKARVDLLDQIKKNNDAFAMRGQQAKAYKVNISSALDNLVNPATKGLDNNSLYLYNIGKKFLPSETGTYKASLADLTSDSFKKFTEQMRRIDPSFGPDAAIAATRGYADMLDELKKVEGRKYVSRSFDEFIKSSPYNLDEKIVMAQKGDYDGCL